jgi:diaminopimelate epimerase
VHCPGGDIQIEIRDGFDILMTGGVTRVAEGVTSPEIFSTKV